MQHDPALRSLDGFGLSSPRSSSYDYDAPSDLRPRLARLASRAALSVALILFAAAAALFWFRSTYSERLFPAISVGGMNVGGLSVPAAQQQVGQEASAFVDSKVSFTFQNKKWEPKLSDLGVTADVNGSLDTAFNIGREDAALDRVTSAWQLLRHNKNLPLKFNLDETVLNQWFDRVDDELGIHPQDASLVYKDGKVSISPDIAGTIVDREQTKTLLLSSIAGLQVPSTALPVIAKTPNVHAVDLETAKHQFELALAKPVKVSFEDKTWTIAADDLAGYFVQQIDDKKSGAAAVSMTLDQKALSKYLSSVVLDEVNRDPVDAVVGWNGSGVDAIEPSVDGTKLKPSTFAAAVTDSFFSDHHNVEVPVVVTKPAVDSKNLGKLGITTRLAVGTSNFDGSDEGRSTNIRVGASLLNSHLIPPHELFSFNHAIGEIGTDKGFVESSVIDGERIGRDVGGGICQVSTTVFRAAYLAGLPIEEWHPHHYRLKFYEQDDWPVGLDASILQPDGNPFGGGDFSFWNPSDSWMLMEAYTDGPRVVIILYGADLGYKVESLGPSMGNTFPPADDVETVKDDLEPGTINQTEYASEGVEVVFDREVYDRDGTLIDSREFYTHFYPRANVWTVSPDMAGQSPAKKGSGS